MHRLIKIRIIRDFEHLEEQVRRGFDTLLEAHKTSVSFRPAADFYETTQGLVLRLELAGVALRGRFPDPDGPRTGGAGPAAASTAGRHPALRPSGDGVRHF